MMFMAIFTPGLQSCDGAINYSSRAAGGKVLVTLRHGSSRASVTSRVTSADNLVFSPFLFDMAAAWKAHITRPLRVSICCDGQR